MKTIRSTITTYDPSGLGVRGSSTDVGTNEQKVTRPVPGGSVDLEYSVSFSHTALLLIVLVASQPMTIKVNDDTTPDLTIDLNAGDPYYWRKNSGYFANPFTTDVHDFYITCPTGGVLEALILT